MGSITKELYEFTLCKIEDPLPIVTDETPAAMLQY